MAVYAGPVQDLIDELGRLPGVGPKSAQRIAFHLLKLPKDDALRLARSIVEVKDKIVRDKRGTIGERKRVQHEEALAMVGGFENSWNR